MSLCLLHSTLLVMRTLCGERGISMPLASIAKTLSPFLEKRLTVPSVVLNLPLVRNVMRSPTLMPIPSLSSNGNLGGFGGCMLGTAYSGGDGDSSLSKLSNAIRMLSVVSVNLSSSRRRDSFQLRRFIGEERSVLIILMLKNTMYKASFLLEKLQ